MPFAELPSSQGFSPPQAPSWEPFALEAIRAIERRPIPNLTEAVNTAVGQINNILQMNSPMGQMQRRLQAMMLSAQYDNFQNYRQHPDQYMLNASGIPVLRDPVERALKYSMIKRNAALAGKADRVGTPPPIVAQINAIAAAHAAGKIPSNNVDSLPPSNGVVVGGSSQSPADNTTDADENEAAGLDNQSLFLGDTGTSSGMGLTDTPP